MSTTTNFTEKTYCSMQDDGFDFPDRYTVAVINFVLSLTATFGNIVISLAIVKCKPLRNEAPAYFIVSLAIADLLIGTLAQTLFVAVLLDWSPATCVLELPEKLVGHFTCSVSTGSSMCVCLDRWFKICKPFRYHQLVTKLRIKMLIVTTWVCGIIAGLLSYWVADPRTVAVATLIWLCNSALVAMFSAHQVFHAAKRQIRAISRQSFSDRRLSFMKERKLAASLFFVVGTFILCWIPYAVGYVVRKYLYSRKTWDLFLRLRVWSMTLGYSNSSMNVFIYSRHNKQIRRAMVSLFRRSKISPERISASGSDDVFVMTKIKRDISQQQT